MLSVSGRTTSNAPAISVRNVSSEAPENQCIGITTDERSRRTTSAIASVRIV